MTQVFAFICLCLLSFCEPARARVVIRVGVVHFPPYIEVTSKDKLEGMLGELLDYLNQNQTKYHFQPVISSAMRRHIDFKNGAFDVSFFDNIEWGWDKEAVVASQPYMRGKEVYVALAKAHRNQSYFNDLSKRSMIGILGYHYGFASFNTDPAYLKKNFRMQKTSNSESSLKMLLAGRGDVAVVSDAFLNLYLKKHPHLKRRFLVSQKIDQAYVHSVILRKTSPLRVEEMNAFLEQFLSSPAYRKIKTRYLE